MHLTFFKLRHSGSLRAVSKHVLLLLCFLLPFPIVWYYIFSVDTTVDMSTPQLDTANVSETLPSPPTSDTPSEPLISLDDPDPQSFDSPAIVGMKNLTQLSFNLPYEQEWRQNAHLVVYGVLATDKAERRAIRDMQRSTWLRYPDVATRRNAFKGLMLVLYPPAPFALVAPNITVDMMKEMDEHHDVLMLRMKEEAPTKQKVIGVPGGYGLAFHVSNSRKLLFYLLYAHYAFPTTPFIAKGDDDSYVYAPEYMRMVMQLPRINVVYGAVHTPKRKKQIRMALGCSYSLTRDVLTDIFKHDAVTKYLNLPVSDKYSKEYVDIGFHNEDWIVGVSVNHLYGGATAATRPLPSLPPADDRLPPVEGWGKHYMEYVFNPNKTAHTGRAVGTDGRYDVTYTFPPPNELKPGNVLFVDDKCRINYQRWPNATERRLIVAHRPTTANEFRAYWEYHEKLGEYESAGRPSAIMITDKGHYSDAELLNSLGECRVMFTV